MFRCDIGCKWSQLDRNFYERMKLKFCWGAMHFRNNRVFMPHDFNGDVLWFVCSLSNIVPVVFYGNLMLENYVIQKNLLSTCQIWWIIIMSMHASFGVNNGLSLLSEFYSVTILVFSPPTLRVMYLADAINIQIIKNRKNFVCNKI